MARTGCGPRADWKFYVTAAVPKPGRCRSTPKGSTERKTGVKHAEVITVRLLQDERGWLRLAG